MALWENHIGHVLDPCWRKTWTLEVSIAMAMIAGGYPLFNSHSYGMLWECYGNAMGMLWECYGNAMEPPFFDDFQLESMENHHFLMISSLFPAMDLEEVTVMVSSNIPRLQPTLGRSRPTFRNAGASQWFRMVHPSWMSWVGIVQDKWKVLEYVPPTYNIYI